MIVSARVVKGGGPDCDVRSLRRTVDKPISQANHIGVSGVKSIDRQNDLTGLRVFKTPVNEVVVGISA